MPTALPRPASDGRSRVNSTAALSAIQQLHAREQELARRDRRRLLVGLAVITILGGVVVPAILDLGLRIAHAFHPDRPGPSPDLGPACLIADAFLLLVTLPVAIFASRCARSGVVNQFLDANSHWTSVNDDPLDPLLKLVLILASVGFLYAEFVIIDAIRFQSVRARLRNVDRHRAALILTMLAGEPRGIDIGSLLRPNENPLHLRQTLVYLMVYEWADMPPNTNEIELLSPSKRELRHAEEAIFAIS